MLNYTNELALPNISDFAKHGEEEVRGEGGAVKGAVVCHAELSRREGRGEARRGEGRNKTMKRKGKKILTFLAVSC